MCLQACCEKRGGRRLQDLIREYGRVMLSVLAGTVAVGILVYACAEIAIYLEFFADELMGG